MTNLKHYWTPVRNYPIAFVADPVWQNTQDIDSFRSNAGGHLLIARPHDAGTLEFSTVYLDGSNQLVPPAQNARLTIQIVEGILVNEIPQTNEEVVKPNAPISIPIPALLVNAGSSIEIRGEESVANTTPVRALTFIGFQSLTLASPPVGATKVLLLARYS